MREIRLYGSEGGGALTGLSLPLISRIRLSGQWFIPLRTRQGLR